MKGNILKNILNIILMKNIMKKLLYPFIYLYCNSPSYKSCKIMSYDDAESILSEKHTRVKADIITTNNISQEVDLMVIVPVYNTVRFVEQCIESLLNQKTKFTYKIVIVNDGSTDGTRAILNKYNINEKIRIIHQENRGFSGARNRALENIIGEYIAFVDSDDVLYDDAIESLMKTALENKADIVEGDFVKINEKNNIISIKDKSVSKRKYNYEIEFREEVWGKVFRAEVFRSIKFPEQYWFEDIIVPYIIYPQFNKKCKIKEKVYQYRYNKQGITVSSKWNLKSIDTVWITLEMLHIINDLNINISTKQLQQMILSKLKINQIRLRMLDVQIQEAAFILLSSVYIDLCEKEKVKDLSPKEEMFSEIVRKQDFRKFRLLCKFWNKR